MDYQKIYDALIERAQTRTNTGYVERHHITPRCLQGTDDQTNIVELTAREHYLAHLLLVKMHPSNHKLIYAAAMMCSDGTNNQRSTNRLYEWLKIKHSAAMSLLHKGKIVSEETRQKLREKNKNYRPTEDAKRRSREAQIGHVVSNETRNKISAANKGGKTRTGQKSSEDHKRKISEAHLARPSLKCPQCGKEGKTNMYRYHFDKCNRG